VAEGENQSDARLLEREEAARLIEMEEVARLIEDPENKIVVKINNIDGNQSMQNLTSTRFQRIF
jgi:hypothetical protein